MHTLSFGPFVLGGNVFGWTVDQEEGFRILDVFLDRGGTVIDTADLYPSWAPGRKGGESEEMIGAWMKARKNHAKVAIATKVAKWSGQPGLSAANIQAAVEGSLRRLDVDTIDLYYAHEDDPKVEQSEYLRAFDALVKEGKVRTLGASNFTPERLMSAVSFAEKNGLARFEVSQDPWSLVERGIEASLVPALEQLQMTELPYFALASGFLTGKYRPGAKVESARAETAQKRLDDPKNVALLGVLDEIAEAHRVSVAAISLAWVASHRVVGAPIASARTVEQLDPLFESATVKLSEAEIARLSAATA